MLPSRCLLRMNDMGQRCGRRGVDGFVRVYGCCAATASGTFPAGPRELPWPFVRFAGSASGLRGNALARAPYN